jgi:hypothetical protein
MKRHVLVAMVWALSTVAPGWAQAANTTNYSDQWWVPSESGWGASVLQQASTLFIDMFVYGTDGRSTWFTVAAYYEGSTPAGNLVFSGDLYQTTGPWFGGTFNPGNVTTRKVGTLTFNSDSVATATVTYSVDGTVVTKYVSRQTWSQENLSGSYYGGAIEDDYSCVPSSANGHYENVGTVQINHSGSAIVLTFQGTLTSCTVTGTYTQTGHLGQVNGTQVCTNGTTGPITMFEIESSISGVTGRYQGQDQYCRYSGRFAGLLR